MGEIEVRIVVVRLVVLHIKPVRRPHPHPGLHQDELGNVLDGGVLEFLEILEDLVGPLRVEGRLGDVAAVRDDRRLDLLEQPRLDCVDSLAPFDEDPDGVHLGLLADDVEVLPSPDPKLVELSGREIVHVVDALLLTPLDQEAQPGAVRPYRRRLALPGLVLEIELQGLFGFDRF